MALSTTQIQQLYTAYLGRPVDREGLDYWQEQDVSLAQLRDSLANDAQPEYVDLYGDRTRAEVVEAIYQNMFGRAADADGLEYWVNGGGSSVPVSQLQQLFIEAASAEDRINFNDRVEADEAQIPPAEGDGGEGVEGETIMLTDGRDNLVGTENDDTFIGDVGQNQNGAVANALATGDRLDGGEGRDKIEASLIADNQVDGSNTDEAPRPITKNIEEVYIEALESASGGVVLDATRMENVEQYWADFGRSDMTFDNVSLQGSNLNITKDVTFGIRDTESSTDFNGFFDSQSLIRESASQVNSSLLVRIADVSTETPTTPLANVDLNLSFDLGGETITLEGVRSTDGTYAGLVEALRNELEEAGFGDVNVNLSTPYSEVTVAGNTVTLPFTAQEILITDPAGNEFSSVNFTQSAIEPVADGFLVAGNAQPQDPSSTSSLIESNLVLDNAGRGSLAGDVVIGGGSNSELGVELFNVIVDRDSSINTLNTTNGRLQQIVITSMGAEGDLFIGGVQANLEQITANEFAGENLSIGANTVDADGSTVFSGTAVADLELLSASDTSANVSFTGDNDNGTVAVLNTGAGDDTIILDQTGQSSPSDASQTRSTINAGNGDNTVTVTGENTSTIVTGTGVDTIRGNAVSITVESGAGNDVIYADNTGATRTVAEIGSGDFSATAGTTTMGTTSTVQNIQLLGGRQVQVTLGLPDATSALAAAFSDGLEVTADIVASEGVLTTERDLYEAVAKAINEDAVLNKLAEASVNSSGDLTITYLIDGETDATVAAEDAIVEMSVLGEYADLSSSQQNSLLQALQEEYSNSTISAADVESGYDAADVTDSALVTTAGVNSAVNGSNVINAGAGDDVVVLSSAAADQTADRFDTVEFDAGQFGNDTIVHFEAGVDNDVLDFAWLNNQVQINGSTSTESREDAAIDLVTTPGAITANDVTVVDFNDFTFGAGVTFDNMSNAQVLASLNEAGGFTVGATTDLVGTTQNSILMVQNFDGTEGNQGEYKVYQVASTNTAGENFTSATLVGSVDFGEEQTFDVSNFA